jgi:PhnB protein
MANKGEPSVVPMLAYEDAASAIDWLTEAFGFREEVEERYTEADDTVTHAQLEHGDGLIMLATPTPDYQSPNRHRQTCEAADQWLRAPWVIDGVLVHVDDIGSHFERAKAAGATMLSDIENESFGRLYRAADLEGHRWMFLEPRGEARNG